MTDTPTIDTILEAINTIGPHIVPKHPQIIDGTLYVTPEQYNALYEYAISQQSLIDAHIHHYWHSPTMQEAVNRIPVTILKPGDYITAQDGSMLVNGKISGLIRIGPQTTRWALNDIHPDA